MPAPKPKSTGQMLYGSVLILLVVLAVILLIKDLARRPPGKSRVDWPEPASAKP